MNRVRYRSPFEGLKVAHRVLDDLLGETPWWQDDALYGPALATKIREAMDALDVLIGKANNACRNGAAERR